MDNRETLKALVELAKKHDALVASGAPFALCEASLSRVSAATCEAVPALEALCQENPHGSSVCPICDKDEPHGHDREQISAWVSGRLAAWGWKAHIYNDFTDKPYGWYYWPHHVEFIIRFSLSRPDDIYGYIPLYSSPPASVPVSELEALADEWQKLSTTIPHNPLDKGRYQCAKDLRSLINRSHK